MRSFPASGTDRILRSRRRRSPRASRAGRTWTISQLLARQPNHLFPATKKQADAYSRYDASTWLAAYRRHLSLLARRYRDFSPLLADRVHAAFVLDLSPGIPPSRPPATDVTRRYRALSLVHHPDRGGDPAMFIRIKRARDVLDRRA